MIELHWAWQLVIAAMLVVGGVFALVGNAAGVPAGGTGLAGPVLACLAGSLSYGWAANYTRRRLSAVAPLTIAAGSQAASALVLAGAAVVAAVSPAAPLPTTTTSYTASHTPVTDGASNASPWIRLRR